ncbi:MAG: hypothetical protein KDI32_00575 [Pseudomonadales bacterium]|nr:hypothetical protein [Pseudomonadales bacterium]
MESIDRMDEPTGSDSAADEARWRAEHAALDASLTRMIRAPQVEQAFDAAVWRRIHADDERMVRVADTEMRSASDRFAIWLAALNLTGCAVAGIGAVLAVAPSVHAPNSLSWTVAALALGLGAWQLPPLRDLARRFF